MLNYGRKIARLSIGKDSTMFVIHEDLLCANSPFFRQELQPGRKDIAGDCSICLGTLEHGPQEITFCKSCGNNFHFGCMEKFKRQAAGNQVSCPLCRHEWIDPKTSQCKKYSQLNTVAFWTYYEWLYKGCITYTQEWDKDQVFHNLLETYQLGVDIEDEKFCSASIEEIVEFAATEFVNSYRCIEKIYCGENEYPSLRQLLVYLYIFLRMKDDTWDEPVFWEEMPSGFMKDVVITLLQDHPLRKGGIDAQTIQHSMSTYNKR